MKFKGFLSFLSNKYARFLIPLGLCICAFIASWLVIDSYVTLQRYKQELSTQQDGQTDVADAKSTSDYLSVMGTPPTATTIGYLSELDSISGTYLDELGSEYTFNSDGSFLITKYEEDDYEESTAEDDTVDDSSVDDTDSAEEVDVDKDDSSISDFDTAEEDTADSSDTDSESQDTVSTSQSSNTLQGTYSLGTTEVATYFTLELFMNSSSADVSSVKFYITCMNNGKITLYNSISGDLVGVLTPYVHDTTQTELLDISMFVGQWVLESDDSILYDMSADRTFTITDSDETLTGVYKLMPEGDSYILRFTYDDTSILDYTYTESKDEQKITLTSKDNETLVLVPSDAH